MFITPGSRPQRKRPAAAVAAVSAPNVIIEDQKAANTSGGASTSGSFQTRTLNTLVRNVSSLASLSSNQFTLPAGTYYIAWSAPAYAADFHKSKIYNISDAVDALIGTSEMAYSPGPPQTRSCGSGILTLAGSKTFELRHRVNTSQASGGYGQASNFGVIEVYSRIEIWKIA